MPSSSMMSVSTTPQNSSSVCQSRPLRARRDASIARTAPTRPSQIAANSLSKPGAGCPTVPCAAEIIVNYLDLAPPELASALDKCVLTALAHNRDRGAPHDAAPPTPPGIRVTYLGGSIGLSFSMQPGFRVLSSSGPVRPFGRNPFLRCQSYSPLPIVRAFDSRFRLGLSVAPPFGLECLTSLADSTAYYALC